MDTNTQPVSLTLVGHRRNRRHTEEFKRALVEQSYLPGCSVARLAREHGINANQVFGWRKLFRESGQKHSGTGTPLMLPVIVTAASLERSVTTTAPAARPCASLELVVGKARLTVTGNPDITTLRAVLAQLLA
jgi:transposase